MRLRASVNASSSLLQPSPWPPPKYFKRSASCAASAAAGELKGAPLVAGVTSRQNFITPKVRANTDHKKMGANMLTMRLCGKMA